MNSLTCGEEVEEYMAPLLAIMDLNQIGQHTPALSRFLTMFLPKELGIIGEDGRLPAYHPILIRGVISQTVRTTIWNLALKVVGECLHRILKSSPIIWARVAKSNAKSDSLITRVLFW